MVAVWSLQGLKLLPFCSSNLSIWLPGSRSPHGPRMSPGDLDVSRLRGEWKKAKGPSFLFLKFSFWKKPHICLHLVGSQLTTQPHFNTGDGMPPRKTGRENGYWLVNSGLCHSLKTPGLSEFRWWSLSSPILGRNWRLTDDIDISLRANWRMQAPTWTKEYLERVPSQHWGSRLHPLTGTYSGVKCEVWGYVWVTSGFLYPSFSPTAAFPSGFCALVASALFHLFLIWRIIRVVM